MGAIRQHQTPEDLPFQAPLSHIPAAAEAPLPCGLSPYDCGTDLHTRSTWAESVT